MKQEIKTYIETLRRYADFLSDDKNVCKDSLLGVNWQLYKMSLKLFDVLRDGSNKDGNADRRRR